MSIKIEVMSTAIDVIEGISQKTKNPYKLNIQTAYFHSEKEAYPVKTKILLDDGQAAYNKGMYTLSDDAFYVDRNGNLALKMVLKPLAASAAQSAASK